MSRHADPFGLNAAFDQLARREACPAHEWGEATSSEAGHGKYRQTWWTARCVHCGARVSRQNVDELLAYLRTRGTP